MIAGSLPPSVPASFAARMVAELKERGVETILDTEGEPLIAGLRAGPGGVTPNASEAEGAVGHEFNDRDDLLTGLRGLIELGAGEAVITREEGCVASLLEGAERRLYEVTAPSLEPVATVGSGDAFLAGFAAARFDGRSASGVPALRGRLRRGVHAALRRRHHRPRGGRPPRRAGRGQGARHARCSPLAAATLGLARG